MTVGSLRTPLALLVDLLWSYAAVALFVQWFSVGDGPAPSFALVALIVVGTFALARFLQSTGLGEDALRVAGVIVVAVALFVALRLEYAPGAWLWEMPWLDDFIIDTGEAVEGSRHVLAGIIALVPLCARAVMRGQQSEIEADDVISSASFGLIAVLLAALTQPETREPSSWGMYAFTYGVVALVTLAVFRAPEPEAPLTQFVRRWSWGLAAVAGAAFGVALIAAAFDPDTFGFLSWLGDPLRVAGSAIGTYVLAPIFWVISLPFVGLRWLLELAFGEPGPQEQPEPAPPEETDTDEENAPLWFRFASAIAIGGGILVLLAIGVTVLWSLFRRYARQQQRRRAVRYDAIEPSSSLGEDLAGMWGALARRFRREGRPGSAVAVRRLYAEMLQAAAADGLERPPAASPLAFAPQLEQHFASPLPGEISAAFIESRYAEREVEAARVARLRDAWKTLRTAASTG